MKKEDSQSGGVGLVEDGTSLIEENKLAGSPEKKSPENVRCPTLDNGSYLMEINVKIFKPWYLKSWFRSFLMMFNLVCLVVGSWVI